MSFADAEARRRIEHDLDATLIVEAAAGTGKTTALIGRIVAVVQSGRASLEHVVAVTFTEKAAGEMKLRLRAALGRARDESADAERDHLEHALAALELAHINTIHGFCADLLRERPLEAGVDPAFEVLDDAASEKLLQEAFDAWFERTLSAPPEGVRRALRRRAWGGERTGPRDQLLRACRDLAEHRDFSAPWTLPDYDRRACIDALLRALRELGALAGRAKNPRDKLVQSLRQLRDLSDTNAARERTRSRDYDGLEAELCELAREKKLWRANGGSRAFDDGVDRSAVLELRDRTHAALEAFMNHAEAELAAKLQQELAEVIAEREQRKRRAGVLDFVDLLLFARDLLRDDAGVRRELQRRFSHVFVDEFQDTDPLQADIVLLLAGHADDGASGELRPSPGKLFVVGDPKQSIYRFRRADVIFYERVKRQLLAAGATLLHLTTSFRSQPQIQTAVNAAFSCLMTGAEDGSQAEYVPLSPYREPFRDQPALVALPVPAPYGWSGLTKRAVDESFPEAAAAFVEWLLHESGWSIEQDGERVAVQAHHVCLLFRRFQSFGQNLTRGYVRALEARRIPHVLLGGRSLHGREEIIALRAALTAIEWPDDELSVYASLRGPLFAIADEDLFCWKSEQRRLNPLARAQTPAADEAQAAVLEALKVLRKLHRRRNQRPIADTIAALLEATRAHAGFAIWPTGEQALANVLGLCDAARVFEARGATSFRAFVDWLADQAERDESGDAPIIEEGTEGVRLMTVHKAKGLEFPIVLLCDPTAPIAANTATRYVDPARGMWAQRLCGCRPLELLEHGDAMLRHESAENVRLAYVAATRARDLLVVPVFGDTSAGKDPGIGWVNALAPALYPSDATRRTPSVAAACPAFGADSVRTRASNVRETADDSVAPGLHEAAGGAEVVWWDPNVLRLDVSALGGVRQQELLMETDQSKEWLDAYEAWRARKAETVARGTIPSLVTRTITELAIAKAESESDSEPDSDSESDSESESESDSDSDSDSASVRVPVPVPVRVRVPVPVPVRVSVPVPVPVPVPVLDPPSASPSPPPIPILRTATDRTTRPRGARFGSLVHATLAYVPLDAPLELIRTIATTQSRIIDATPAELAAAVTAVVAALAHPVMRRAAMALELRREVPVTHLQPDGVLAEGVIDLAFREAAGWTVVDYKTDAELTESAQYAEQVRLYVEAVHAATGLAASGLLLAV